MAISKAQKQKAKKIKDFIILKADSWMSLIWMAKELWTSETTLRKYYYQLRKDEIVPEINWQKENHVMTIIMLEKLKVAFAMGFTDVEASLYCDLNISTLNEYCSRNHDFRELKESLKQKPVMKAKLNVLESLNSKGILSSKQRLEDSKWYLERKAKDEFGTRQEITGAGGVPFQVGTVEFVKPDPKEHEV